MFFLATSAAMAIRGIPRSPASPRGSPKTHWEMDEAPTLWLFSHENGIEWMKTAH